MSWCDTRLKFLADIPIRTGVGEAGGQDDPSWPRYIRTTDIAGPRRLRDDVFASLPPDVAAGAMLRRGDIVMTAAGATVGKMLLYERDTPACYAGYLARFRARADVDRRFIAYWMESQVYWDQVRLGTVTSTIDNFSSRKYQNMRIRVPSFRHQRSIANYLDDETARIDELVEKNQRMIELLAERHGAVFPAALSRRGFAWANSLENPTTDQLPPGWIVAHLSVTLERLTNGYVGPTRDILVDEGIRYIQSLHIKDGAIVFSRRPFYVAPDWHNARPRIHLRPGDVLIVQTGDIGQVAVVPTDFGVASCHALQIARVKRDLLSGEYLGMYLRSPFGQQSLLSRTTGALHPHLEGGIRDVPIVVPPLDAQAAIIREVDGLAAELNRLRLALGEQIDLAFERRHALITAAVTGRLEVSGIAA